MKITPIAAILLSALLSINVFAQSSTSLQLATEAQSDFDQYLANHKRAIKSQLNMQIVLRNLPKSKKNIQAIRGILSSKISNPEKIDALRLLGTMHDRLDAFGENHNIARDLKGHIAHSDKSVAAAALYSYTRNVHDEEYLTTIKQAKDLGIIGNNEYFGEHAHVLQTVTPYVQKTILEEISKSRNEYALQILAASLNSERNLKLSHEIEAQVLNLLIENEPKFPVAIGVFGGFSNFQYENWLLSVARLQQKSGSGDYYNIIITILSKDGTDARKALTLFSSPFGKELAEHTKEASRIATLVGRMCDYANSFPTTASIQIAAKEMESNIGSSFKEFKGMTCSKYGN